MIPVSMEACKVLWIGTDGYRRDCEVTFGDFDGMQVDILINHPDGCTCPLRLRSIDGFRFIGKTVINGRPFVVPATLYRHEEEFLFFGTWLEGNDSGEFVIHARTVKTALKRAIHSPELHPAA